MHGPARSAREWASWRFDRLRRTRASALIVAFEDAALGPLRPGLDVVSATDGLWVSITPRYAHQLASLGWSLEHRSTWTTRIAIALILPTDPRSSA